MLTHVHDSFLNTIALILSLCIKLRRERKRERERERERNIGVTPIIKW